RLFIYLSPRAFITIHILINDAQFSTDKFNAPDIIYQVEESNVLDFFETSPRSGVVISYRRYFMTIPGIGNDTFLREAAVSADMLPKNKTGGEKLGRSVFLRDVTQDRLSNRIIKEMG